MVGEERGRETEYGMQAETECEVLLKGGCTGEEGERRRLPLQKNGTGQGAGKLEFKVILTYRVSYWEWAELIS